MNDKEYCDARFQDSCQRGKIKKAQKYYNGIIGIDSEPESAFKWACRVGNMPVVLELYKKVNIYDKENKAFNSACINGKTKIVKFLFTLDPNIITLFDNYVDTFILTCKNGNTKIVEWLLTEIKYDDETYTRAFNEALHNEYKYILKLLYKMNINLMHINFTHPPTKRITKKIFHLDDKESDLFIATINKDILIMKKCIEEGVDFSILNDFVFLKSCANNNIEIVRYLSDMSSRYTFMLNGANNRIIDYDAMPFPKNTINNPQ